GIESRADGAATITASDTAGAEGSYLVTVTGNALVLARPEPDFMDSQGNIDIGDISASTGLRVVVKQYTGMAVGQAITLTCYSAIGNHVPATQTVAALGDIAFHVPKSYIQDIVAALETPMAAFDYTVAVVGGATAKSPRTNVTFIG
ncbi:hypothetical protein SAMN02800694_3718, partial [Luteibacter sp. UNCMF331Sha3.1]|uniref:hypothetical protein n=1 Tax=Luteibacter sp. UNCMF331Sha3.1 TaxID=1502760 RepID=UPI0008D8913A